MMTLGAEQEKLGGTGGNGCLTGCLGLLFGGLLALVVLFFVRERFFKPTVETLNCDELPAVEVVAETIKNHSELRAQIELVDPDGVRFEVDTESCPGKAGIVVWYRVGSDRQRIKNLIGGQTFFGVPYQLRRY